MPDNSASDDPNLDRTSAMLETPMGYLAVCGRGGVAERVLLGFTDEDAATAWLEDVDGGRRSPADWGDSLDAMAAYVRGESFALADVPRREPGNLSEFARAVRRVVAAIPYGETRTYGEVAEIAGRPRAARAVGTVMSGNSLTLLMPCHRVVPAGQKPGQYNSPGGVAVKLKLLAMEAAAAETARG